MRLRFHTVSLMGFGEKILPYLFFVGMIALLWHESTRKGQILRTLYVSERLESNILSLETSQRGYLLTADPDFLNDFVGAKAQYAHWVSNLCALLRGDNEDSQKLDQVEQFANGKIAEMSDTIELVKSGKQQQALQIVATRRGQRYMSNIRSLMQDIRVNKEVELVSTF